MTYFELATLTLPVGMLRGEPLAEIVAAIRHSQGEPEADGTLLGCWISELGPQNRIVLLRGFGAKDALDAERERVLRSGSPFGCGRWLADLTLESFAPFPDRPPLEPGGFGPVYEFRTYKLKIGGLAPTLAAWAAGVPARTALSPLVTAMYALDGTPRFIHVWAYRSFEERLAIRARAFETGVWPAKGAPEWLTTDMTSEIYWPTALSPLQ